MVRAGWYFDTPTTRIPQPGRAAEAIHSVPPGVFPITAAHRDGRLLRAGEHLVLSPGHGPGYGRSSDRAIRSSRRATALTRLGGAVSHRALAENRFPHATRSFSISTQRYHLAFAGGPRFNRAVPGCRRVSKGIAAAYYRRPKVGGIGIFAQLAAQAYARRAGAGPTARFSIGHRWAY